jgi:hypothetical protein
MNIKSTNKVLPFFLPLILLLIGLYLVPLKIFGPDFSKIPGDFGDARFNNYILEHGHLFITGQINSFWDAPFMYPFKNVISLSDNLLGSMPIYSAFRVLGADRETAFQLWFIILFVLNFICCYWALQKWFGNTFLSATGAYIFTFSIFIIGHIYNVQVFPRFMVPLILYWTWKYINERHVKYFLFISLGVVYQFYCGIYLGFLLVYVLIFFFISYLIIYRDKLFFIQFKNLKTVLLHFTIMTISLALLAPLMLPYIEISHRMGMRDFEDAISSIPTLRSYFFTSKASVLWLSLSEHGVDKISSWWCHFLFLGALPWLGILSVPFFLYSKRIDLNKKKFLLFLSLTLFFSFIFCLNIEGFTLYRLIFKLPGFSSMRAINRIINTEVVLFILIFVFSFNELRKHYTFVKMLVFAFPILIIVDNLIDPMEVNRFDKHESQQQIALVKKNIHTQYNKIFSAVAYSSTDYHGNEIRINLNVMLAAQELGVPVVNAYTGSFPERYWPLLGIFNDTGLKQWCEYTGISRNNIQYVNDLGIREKQRSNVQLLASNGMFVCSDGSIGNTIIANKEKASGWETFTLIKLADGKYIFVDYNGKILSTELGNNANITANRINVGSWEKFTLLNISDQVVAIKAINDKYLSLDIQTGQLFAKSDSIGPNERFTLSFN